MSMYAYFLQNGTRIDAERVIDALLDEGDGGFPRVYLDTETGAFVEIPSADVLARWSAGADAARYRYIEPLGNALRDGLAREFADTLVPDLEPRAIASVRRALAAGYWRDLEDFLAKEKEDLFYAWEDFLEDAAAERAHTWFTEEPGTGITAVFEGCGNCAMCRVLAKAGGRDHEKLLEAFTTEGVLKRVAEQLASRAAKAPSRKPERKRKP